MDKAINDQLNDIAVHLKQTSDLYNEFKLMYIGEGLSGFAAFAKNESKERWKACDTLRIKILKHGGVIGAPTTPPALPVPEFTTPLIPITSMVANDKTVLNVVNTALTAAKEQNIHCGTYILTDLCNTLLHDYSEVKQIEVRVTQILTHPERLLAIDRELLYRYGYSFGRYERQLLAVDDAKIRLSK